jgi:hypothetical protein
MQQTLQHRNHNITCTSSIANGSGSGAARPVAENSRHNEERVASSWVPRDTRASELPRWPGGGHVDCVGCACIKRARAASCDGYGNKTGNELGRTSTRSAADAMKIPDTTLSTVAGHVTGAIPIATHIIASLGSSKLMMVSAPCQRSESTASSRGKRHIAHHVHT